MKHIILTCLSIFTLNVLGQNTTVTTTLMVKGNCEQCKKRIENAADIKGVKLFEWNEDTKVAKVIYNSAKTDLATIEKAIAASGYDTEHEKGQDKAYSKLPKCCQYREGTCPDKK